MNIDALDLLRWGLYAITAVLGVALVVWLLRDRALRRTPIVPAVEVDLSPRAVAAPPPATDPTVLADALAGIQIPVHWVPNRAPEIVPPIVLTTERDSPLTVARLLSAELTRLGYHLHPVADNAAHAVKDANHLRVEVDAVGSAVTATITVAEEGTGG